MQFEIGNTRNYDHEKKPIYKSARVGNYYCIFRVGKCFKTPGQITGFEKHMERLQDTPNANPSIKNEILIGGTNLADRVKDYIKDVRYKTDNTVIARELMITASPDFFKGISKQDLNLWVDSNLNYLEKKYGSMVIYSCFHLDEKTPHIHCLLSPKTWSEARHCYVLSSRKLFGDKIKLRNLQTEYAEHMSKSFQCLKRGIENSKAKHIEIKHFYGILKNVRSLENSEQIYKRDILLTHKLKGLEATLNAYKSMLSDKEKNIEELQRLNLELKIQVKEIQRDKELYKKAVKQLSLTYKLPQNAIEKTLKYMQEMELKR